MRIVLVWQQKDPRRTDLSPQRIGARLLQQFGGLFDPLPTLQHRTFGTACVAWLELPVSGLKVPLWEEQGDRFALAVEYPLNARRLVRDAGVQVEGGKVLLALSSLLESARAKTLAEMIPPGAIVSGNKDRLVVQNDGLGQAQLFEYEDDEIYVLSNRVMAMRSLGVVLRPSTEDWAVRMVAGWFPQARSGFHGVRYVKGGSRIELQKHAVRREVTDVVRGWVKPAAMERQDAFELGRHAMMDLLTDANEIWTKPSVGLSGGWDSRTVVSCLRVLGFDYDLRVRGSTTNVDVMIAAELARMAGLKIRIKEGGGLPSDTVEGCRRSLQKSLLWQSGNFATLKHKNFLAREGKDKLDGGVVNVMGQHGGIGKADFARKIDAGQHPPERYEELLLDVLMREAPVYLRPDQFGSVREILRQAYHAADDHGLTGRGPLHYLFLNEYTRRWGSATVNSQTGLVVAPFLSPNMIRACYALPEEELVTKPMHRYITKKNAPEWAAFPFEDQVTEEDLRSGRVPAIAAPESKPGDENLPEWRQQRRRHKFGYRSYWRTMAYPLVDEAFAQGGFWTEIFDLELAKAHWLDGKTGGDLISILHLLPSVAQQDVG
ncbi:MAG: hypothetical protein ABL997_18685 [Planctomycetota bacterium]